MLRPPRHIVLLNWASAILEAVGLLWPLFLSTPPPTLGRRHFNSLPGAPGLFVISLLSALWLSVLRWHTRDRMIKFAWIVGSIGFVALFTFDVVFGLPLVWAALWVRDADATRGCLTRACSGRRSAPPLNRQVVRAHSRGIREEDRSSLSQWLRDAP
jgi:hypothetical protein